MIDTSQCIIEHPLEDLDFEKWQRLVDMMAKLYDAASGVVVQFRQDVFNVVSTSSNEDNFLQMNVSWPWDMRSFCRRIVETNDKVYVNDAEASKEWCSCPPVADGPVRSYLGYPLYWPDGSLFGSFCIIDTKPTDYSPALIDMLGQLKLIVESELKHIFHSQKITKLLADKVEQEALLKRMALYDCLTGCANRILLKERFEYELAKAQRDESTFSIAYLDLDDFKPVNDEYGHEAGDEVLKTIVQRIKQTVRSHDLVARVGGDEFVVLFNNHIDDMQIKQKLATELSIPITYESHALTVTASIGLARYPEDGDTLAKLMKAADAQMYLYKKARQAG